MGLIQSFCLNASDKGKLRRALVFHKLVTAEALSGAGQTLGGGFRSPMIHRQKK
jgi:hypothetical protein